MNDILHGVESYQISLALKEDLLQIAIMSAKFTMTNDLVKLILLDPGGASSDPVKPYRDMALYRYAMGLTASIGLRASSCVLKASTSAATYLIDASAWIQYFYPDTYWQVAWKDEPGTFEIPPSCVDANHYRFIQNALQTNRKKYMQGKEHYCALLKPPYLHNGEC